MFQKFFSDTIMSRYIKHLLSTEKIPLLDSVTDGDTILEGCNYIYKGLVIRCVSEGRVFSDMSDNLYPSDILYPSSRLLPGTAETPAKFRVLAYYDEYHNTNMSYSYLAKNHWYDSETHRHLGNYLRYLRDHKKINLMPFYNCFNDQLAHDFHLVTPTTDRITPSNNLYPSNDLYPDTVRTVLGVDTNVSYILTSNSAYQVYLIPIKFNQTYTIALDCPSPIHMRSVIYDNSGMVKYRSLKNSYYSDMLEESYMYKSVAQFHKPFTYSVRTDSATIYLQQDNLYLALQLPSACSSSIVVLEGDYTSSAVRNDELYPKLSLLRMNTHESYAFSDRLVEFLVNNAVTSESTQSGTLHTMQKSLAKEDETYNMLCNSNNVTFGVWDPNIQKAVIRVVNDRSKSMFFEDQNGFINKDIEKLLAFSSGRR